ncbi:MAG: hypothetical protein QXI93_02565 [Candidatus Methanomethylicia archaeon]
MFGTSGVRGELNNFLTPELAVKLSEAFSLFLGGSGRVALGFDPRSSSKVLVEACLSGAMFYGLDVLYAGLIPTPVLLHLVKVFDLDGAIMVSASHTPPNYCGILFFKGDSGELSPMDSMRIEEYVSLLPPPTGKFGSIEILNDVGDIYVDSVLKDFNVRNLCGLDLKIAIDIGNSPYAPYFGMLCEYLGIDFIAINSHPDGLFPGRGADVKPADLIHLSNLVKDGVVDFGFGVDGDGDRCIFVDENGNILMGDVVGALFAREALLSSSGNIVCPINTSNIIHHISNRFGGKIIFTRIGPPEIVESIRMNPPTIFAFEESGKYIWPRNILYGDPGYALIKMLEIINKYGSISKVILDFPKYSQLKIAIPCIDDYKGRVLSILKDRVEEIFSPKEIICLDGLKLILDDDSWILFRPSGTEAVFRVFVESLDENKALKILDIGGRLVKDVITQLSK